MGTWNRMVTRRDPGMETCLCSSLLVFPVACRVLRARHRSLPTGLEPLRSLNRQNARAPAAHPKRVWIQSALGLCTISHMYVYTSGWVWSVVRSGCTFWLYVLQSP